MILFVAITYVTASLASIAAYAIDKRRARQGGRRIPEATLHVLSLAGGWPGASIAARWFRHKTQKLRFRAVEWVIVAIHALAWVGWWRANSPG